MERHTKWLSPAPKVHLARYGCAGKYSGVGYDVAHADALQSGTRTLLTEIDIPNPDDALAPGTYCAVELKIPRVTPSFVVPAEAIIFNRHGLQVAVVSNGRAEIRKLRVTRDFGTWVQADAGVSAGEQVILNPPVTLIDGGKVKLRSDATAPVTGTLTQH